MGMNIVQYLLKYDEVNKQWLSPTSDVVIKISNNNQILFGSGDGKEYTVILHQTDQYFDTNSENYLFLVNPFNLCLTAEAESETPGLEPLVYVRIGGNVIKPDAPPKIIIQS